MPQPDHRGVEHRRDIEALVAQLSVAEKARLTAGEDFWSTAAVERLGIPKVGLTDGPNGARGPHLPGSAPPSVCLPCGSAIGATWDPDLAAEVAALLAREARQRGCRVLLAPTVNLHRSPLAGRNFECYSEDPLLAGRLAAAFVRGALAEGVIATVKHLVGNESEHERASISSVIDPRSLRELYLLPFEIAVRDGGALALMTAYNRLNGRWLSEQAGILHDIVRGDWGFAGLIMTDWFAVADTVVSATAGLDLEMPGPGRAFGPALAAAVAEGTVPEEALDAMVGRLLRTFDRVGVLDEPTPPDRPGPDRPDDRDLARRAAAAATVLLRNDGLLPLAAAELTTLAVLGPNADTARIGGGGSAAVTPHYRTTPLDALRAALADCSIVHQRGCDIDRAPRPLGAPGLACDGFEVEIFAGAAWEGPVVHRRHLPEMRFFFFDPPAADLPAEGWSLRARATVVARESGRHRFALTQCGRARVLVDGAVLLDGVTHPPPPGGTDFYGLASEELEAELDLVAGSPVDVVVEFRTHPGELAALRVGFRLPDVDDLLERAVDAAAAADVCLVVVGTSDEWETETRNRTSWELPGRQAELVRRAAAANPRTIVIVNAGAAVDLSCAEEAAAVLQCWFGGQEMASALADVVTGAAEPGGRLPMTVPHRFEHHPSHDNFPGENGELRYGEGLFMGYRGFDHRRLPVRFAFGHGLGYTSFLLEAPELSSSTFRRGDHLEVAVPVRNTGDRRGAEVVQCYVAPDAARLARPPKELKAFAKVTLDPGQRTVVRLELDDRSFSYWDPGQPDWESLEPRLAALFGVERLPPAERREPGWQLDAGTYQICVGRSAGDLAHRVAVEVLAPPDHHG